MRTMEHGGGVGYRPGKCRSLSARPLTTFPSPTRFSQRSRMIDNALPERTKRGT